MAEARRPRAATEEKRRRILDAAEEIMLKDGYAAISSRSVATAVGIQAPLVHYYFASLDDLSGPYRPLVPVDHLIEALWNGPDDADAARAFVVRGQRERADDVRAPGR